MVGVGSSVTIVDQERIVVDAIEKVDHLVDGEVAVAVVVQQGVQGLQLLCGRRGRSVSAGGR